MPSIMFQNRAYDWIDVARIVFIVLCVCYFATDRHI